jgi:hypothetical protein
MDLINLSNELAQFLLIASFIFLFHVIFIVVSKLYIRFSEDSDVVVKFSVGKSLAILIAITYILTYYF